jgi:hypothetical protein
MGPSRSRPAPLPERREDRLVGLDLRESFSFATNRVTSAYRGEAVVVDEVLPDRYRVAAGDERSLLLEFLAHLLATRRNWPLLDDNYTSPPHCLGRNPTGRGSLPHVLCYRRGERRERAMGRRMSLETRRELVRVIGERYRASTSLERGRILDEFVAATGYHRKHAIRVLAGCVKPSPPREPRLHLYDAAVREALIVLWEASDRVCGKRLKPLIPILLEALERHGHLHSDREVRARLLKISASTIDRLLAPTRSAVSGRTRRPTTPSVRRAVAVRTFNDWNDPPPGFTEADLVSHCGGSVAGSFVHTLTVTDIASGWTECAALAVREATLVVQGVTRLRGMLPFQLRGLDTDNGSEFLNETMLAYCQEQSIEFTRSRPYRKNDQAWVEQKNGAVVRRLVGYGRLEGVKAAEALTRLYANSRLFVNFFQPSFKLASKTRVGARVQKRYHPPATPCSRLLALDTVSESVKERLRVVAATLDPLRLLDEIRAAQQHLAKVAAGEVSQLIPTSDTGLEQFLAGLSSAWRNGEVRPTHRPQPKPRRHWRTRKDPFEACWPRVRDWLVAEPDRTAKELLQRLQWEMPGQFTDGQARTLQRRVKQWRGEAVRSLIFAAPDFEPGPEKMLELTNSSQQVVGL